jgi:uncharacterized lipoprotein YajG
VNRKVRAGSIPASSTKQKQKIYIYKHMKQLFIIAALVTLASCSNETTSTPTDTTCVDSVCCDSVTMDSCQTEVKL